jgi:hypothetical protein
MYGQPVVNLDARTFKRALSVEHAAVHPRSLVSDLTPDSL